MKNKKLNLIFVISMSVLTFALGLSFLIQVLRVYFGNGSYDRELVGSYLLAILPVIILWILAVIGFGIYYTINVNPKEKNKKQSNLNVYKLLLKNTNLDDSSLEEKEALTKQKKFRLIIQIGAVVIVSICAILSLLFVLNSKNYNRELPTESVRDITIHLIPFAIIAFGILIAAMFIVDINTKKSIAVLKQIKRTKSDLKADSKNKKLVMNISKCAILALALVLIIVGIVNGGVNDVFLKAINICTECIGLG